jgi:hypothetical protein
MNEQPFFTSRRKTLEGWRASQSLIDAYFVAVGLVLVGYAPQLGRSL